MNALLFHVSNFIIYYMIALVIKAKSTINSKTNVIKKYMNALLFHVSSFTIYYINALVIKAKSTTF
jgi:hypothetical protein